MKSSKFDNNDQEQPTQDLSSSTSSAQAEVKPRNLPTEGSMFDESGDFLTEPYDINAPEEKKDIPPFSPELMNDLWAQIMQEHYEVLAFQYSQSVSSAVTQTTPHIVPPTSPPIYGTTVLPPTPTNAAGIGNSFIQPSSPSADVSTASAGVGNSFIQPSSPSADVSTPSARIGNSFIQPSSPNADAPTASAGVGNSFIQASSPSVDVPTASAGVGNSFIQASSPSADVSTPSAGLASFIGASKGLEEAGPTFTSEQTSASSAWIKSSREQPEKLLTKNLESKTEAAPEIDNANQENPDLTSTSKSMRR